MSNRLGAPNELECWPRLVMMVQLADDGWNTPTWAKPTRSKSPRGWRPRATMFTVAVLGKFSVDDPLGLLRVRLIVSLPSAEGSAIRGMVKNRTFCPGANSSVPEVAV